MDCALDRCCRVYPPALPSRPLAGLAAINVHPTSTSVLQLGFAFGPSRGLIDPAGNTTSADFSTASSSLAATAVPHHPANRPSDEASGTPAEISPVKATTFIAPPPRLRNGPLTTTGFAVTGQLARTVPPHTRTRRHRGDEPCVLGSRLRLRLPSHPASRLRSCPWLVVGVFLHRGLAPPSCWSCQAHPSEVVDRHDVVALTDPRLGVLPCPRRGSVVVAAGGDELPPSRSATRSQLDPPKIRMTQSTSPWWLLDRVRW